MEQFILWMGGGKRHLVATVRLLRMCQKVLFPPAACVASEPGLKFRKALKRAAAGLKHAPKQWVLAGCKAPVAAAFHQDRDSSCSANTR